MREIINMNMRTQRQSIHFIELFITNYVDLVQRIDMLIDRKCCIKVKIKVHTITVKGLKLSLKTDVLFSVKQIN